MDGEYIIGLDLSLTGTGLADYNMETGKFTCETFGTKGKRTDTFEMRGERLRKMADYIVKWATAGPADPSLVVVEAPSYGSQNGSQHDRSGLWWLVIGELQRRGIPIAYVAPRSRAKYATGNGNSGKDVVLAHVIERYGEFVEDTTIRNDNEADAVTLAAIGARLLGEPQEETLPESNLSVMGGIEFL